MHRVLPAKKTREQHVHTKADGSEHCEDKIKADHLQSIPNNSMASTVAMLHTKNKMRIMQCDAMRMIDVDAGCLLGLQCHSMKPDWNLKVSKSLKELKVTGRMSSRRPGQGPGDRWGREQSEINLPTQNDFRPNSSVGTHSNSSMGCWRTHVRRHALGVQEDLDLLGRAVVDDDLVEGAGEDVDRHGQCEEEAEHLEAAASEEHGHVVLHTPARTRLSELKVRFAKNSPGR